MTFESWLKSLHPNISSQSANSVLKLSSEGSTIPFIARYRKEQTGNLDEVAIQNVIDSKELWDDILKKQNHIIGEIEKQGKLTDDLKLKITSSFNLENLEDLYLPFKVKRKSKAAKAKEAGLQLLADWIWNCGHGLDKPHEGQTLELWALTFRKKEKGINDVEQAIQGAQDILIERISEIQELRELVRKSFFSDGYIKTSKASKALPNSKFEKYFEYQEKIKTLTEPQNSHRYLAIRRGWMEEELKLNILNDEEPLLKTFEVASCSVSTSHGASILLKSAKLALRTHVIPSIESEVHQALKNVADIAAIKVFSENVKKLLLASPFGPKAVLGIDPGIRTGCKVVVVDDSGKFIASTVMQLQSDQDKKNAKELLNNVLNKKDVGFEIRAVAVGNGTAGRETELFVRNTIKGLGLNIQVIMVNESGASVYSASDVAREEFPELDVTVRGAISIARRLQDPLAELVKIDPKSIGVGQYQHDVSPHQLKKSLDLVVDSCVNQVGVNLNTASCHLLSRVSGIGPTLAQAIVKYRNDKGLFKTRDELNQVSRFSKKAFEQAAGFLRIPNGNNPLDNTGVHPERYSYLEELSLKLKCPVKDLLGSGVALVKNATELKNQIGEFTFDDIVKELEKPGRDPREEFVAFHFRDDIHEIKDLKQGMMCPGIVTNVTNFGAFVDIGVHQDGLVHLSQLSDKFIKDPSDVVSPGDRVHVKVIEINLDKSQIALSMKTVREHKSAPRETIQERNVQPVQTKSSGKKIAPPNTPKPPKPKEAFNNPFGGLANLLKKKTGS